MRRLVLVLAVTLASVHAAAHVAPSVDDNNRYLKVTPLGDRVRLAYTVFFGEVPGAQMRRTIDADRNGTISEQEGHTFGTRIAAEVAASLELTVDGAAQRVRWREVSVGMGSTQTAAGSFSVDLVTYLCLAGGPRHEVRLLDRFKLTRPGETEVKVEDSPGVSIQRARIGPATDPSREFRFVGAGGPLTDDGLDVAFTVSDTAPRSPDATCGAVAGAGRPSKGLIVGAAAALALVAAAIVVLVRRIRRRRAQNTARG